MRTHGSMLADAWWLPLAIVAGALLVSVAAAYGIALVFDRVARWRRDMRSRPR